MKIAIVGAGITGLVAALDLSSKGHTVKIFEQSSSIGGLAGSFPTHGTSLEKTYHHALRTYTDLVALVQELGIQDAFFWKKIFTGIYYKGQLHPFSNPWDLLHFSPLSFLSRLRTGLVILYLQKTRSWGKFVSVPAYQWLRRWAGRESYEVIWEPLLREKFHKYYQSVSMAWLWDRIRARALSKKIGYFRGGFRTLIETLQKELQVRSVPFHLNAHIEGITAKRGEVQPILLCNGQQESFDRILFTGSCHAFHDLLPTDVSLPAGYRESLLRIQYLGAISLVFASPQSLSPFYWTNIHSEESPFIVCIQHTNLMDPAAYGGEHMYYLGDYLPHDHHLFALSDEQVMQEFFSSLKKIFPEFREEQVTEKHVFRSPYAQHVAEVEYPKIVPGHRTPLPHVYLANFGQVFPEDRGIGAAVRDGKAVARMMLEDP